MPVTKVGVSIDRELLHTVDRWVARGEFRNRSQVIQAGLTRLQQERLRKRRLLAELEKLDATEEQAMADEALCAEPAWPEF